MDKIQIDSIPTLTPHPSKKEKFTNPGQGKPGTRIWQPVALWSCQLKVITAIDCWCKYIHERNIGIAKRNMKVKSRYVI